MYQLVTQLGAYCIGPQETMQKTSSQMIPSSYVHDLGPWVFGLFGCHKPSVGNIKGGGGSCGA